MIISHENQFVFARVMKAASTSGQAALRTSNIIGPNDVATTYRDDPLRGPMVPAQNIDPKTLSFQSVLDAAEYPYQNSFYDAFPERQLWVIFVGHLTPTEMVRLGLITEEQLLTYDLFAFLRDPKQRWISGYFFECAMKGTTPSLEDMQAIIRSDPNLPVFFNRPQSCWFKYEGEVIGRACKHENFAADIASEVSARGGSLPKVPQFKTGYRPEWSRAPLSTWMDGDCVATLTEYLADDQTFYDSMIAKKRGNV